MIKILTSDPKEALDKLGISFENNTVSNVLLEGKQVNSFTLDTSVTYYLVHKVGDTFNFQKQSYDTERQLRQGEMNTSYTPSIWERILNPIISRLLAKA